MAWPKEHRNPAYGQAAWKRARAAQLARDRGLCAVSGAGCLATATALAHIRRDDLNGTQTDAIDLSLSEVEGMITALLEAASTCWGVPPGDVLPPQYRQDDGT